MADEIDRLAVLIDADNTSPRVVEGLFLEIAKLGDASVRRIYGDFSDDRLKSWTKVLAPYAIIPQQQFSYTTGKNSADITLVIDAMDLLHSGRFDGFCLVSSDSDFTRLASRIREQGVDVYGFGQKKTPEAFRQACRRFFYIENLMPEGEPAPNGEGEEVVTASPGARYEAPSRAVPIIRKAMEGLTDEDGWVSLGVIGQRLGNIAPDFDSRTYGSSKLSDAIRRTGAFELEMDDANHMRVRLRPGNGKSRKEADETETAEPEAAPKPKAKPRARKRTAKKPAAKVED